MFEFARMYRKFKVTYLLKQSINIERLIPQELRIY
jgi:hypothetical protein